MASERSYEYKIVQLDRRTARPIALGAEVESLKSCLVADIDAMYGVLDKVNPRRGFQNVIPEADDRELLASSFARIITEMFGADVYYRKVDSGDNWRQVKGALPGGRRVE